MTHARFLAFFVTLSFVLTGSVSAQTYTALGGGTVTPSYCSTLSDLSFGSSDSTSGGEVSRVQSVLVAQQYPGGGAWMITGHFGAATRQAVLLYQRQHNLYVTGSVDEKTRATMGLCTSSLQYAPVSLPTAYMSTVTSPVFGSPYANIVSSTCGFGSSLCATNARPAITYVTPQIGSVGTSVTIYGSGFSRSNNAIHFGPGVIASLMSLDGTSLSFTVPASLVGYGSGATVLGTYQVSVSDASGTISNQVPFTVVASNSTPVATSSTRDESDTYTSAPVISSIVPAVGRPGALVIIQGANFAPSGNIIHFGTGGSLNVSSSNDGTIIYFTIPYTTSSCDVGGSSCNPVSVSAGVYPVSVETGSGTSGVLTLTVSR